MKLTKSKLKEIIREEFLKEQALFPVKVDMQVDFTGTESNEEKFVADVEKAIQGVIDNSGVNITWTVNDYSMNEEIQNFKEEGQYLSTKQALKLKKMNSKDLTNKKHVQKLAKRYKVDYDILKNHIEREFGYLKVK